MTRIKPNLPIQIPLPYQSLSAKIEEGVEGLRLKPVSNSSVIQMSGNATKAGKLVLELSGRRKLSGRRIEVPVSAPTSCDAIVKALREAVQPDKLIAIKTKDGGFNLRILANLTGV